MRTPLKRLTRPLIALAAIGILAGTAACSSSSSGDTSSTGSAAAEDGSIIFIHDQAAGDGSVTDSTIAGVEDAADQLGYTSQAVYVADPANYESTLRNAADSGATVIVTEFFRITDATNLVAADYPDIKFVHLYADPEEPAISNLLTVSYDSYQVLFLSGVMAATYSDTGKIGMVMGDTQPMIAADFNAYAAGAASVDPSIEVIPGVVGNYDDAAKAQEVANQLYASGVDVIQTDAGGADSGTVAAAMQEPGRFLIASTLSVFDTAPDQTLAVGGLEFGPSAVESIMAVLEPDFEGGHNATGIGEALKLTVADPAPGGADATRFQAAVDAVDAASAGVIDGTTEVPFVTEMP
ncbi:BMP family ABC transporter substrate-binding protein [Herbiconiux daphne]|uniref:BMP family ABC transporter substrate-binding protein n=1 Tax=Herbiconiux daphne TaxID=2970914 RepID=A0ABT2H348_9MICO|nr:BMP family ABC transporter substrate-binding protein [Herbiconiux daphne]MCS5734365.1 BMP family ABC transporter substrate-binding protein [Herbiconiux daphne]